MLPKILAKISYIKLAIAKAHVKYINVSILLSSFYASTYVKPVQMDPFFLVEKAYTFQTIYFPMIQK